MQSVVRRVEVKRYEPLNPAACGQRQPALPTWTFNVLSSSTIYTLVPKMPKLEIFIFHPVIGAGGTLAQ